MKPPKWVDLPPFRIRIKKDTEACNAGGVTGVAFPDESRIFYKGGLSPEVERETIHHELLHVLNALSGVFATVDLGGDKERAEESVVRATSPHMLNLWRLNPQLRDYLLEGAPF